MRCTLSINILLALTSSICAFTVAPISTSTKSNNSVRSSKTVSFAECSSCGEEEKPKKDDKPVLVPLQPFVPAMDPNYINIGPVGESDFFISRTGGPIKEELSNENLYKILMIECTDLEVNTLVWKCMGYRFDEEIQEWTAKEVFPKWKEKYPTPPDLIGMQRIYSKEVDQPSLKANQSLVRSVPVDNKQSLKTHLKPLGFTGYKVSSLIYLYLKESIYLQCHTQTLSNSFRFNNIIIDC